MNAMPTRKAVVTALRMAPKRAVRIQTPHPDVGVRNAADIYGGQECSADYSNAAGSCVADASRLIIVTSGGYCRP